MQRVLVSTVFKRMQRVLLLLFDNRHAKFADNNFNSFQLNYTILRVHSEDIPIMHDTL